MTKNIGFFFIAVLGFLSLSLATTAEDLRNQLDSALAAKVDLREERAEDLDNLHIFFDNLQIKRNTTNLKDKELLVALRDYIASRHTCESHDYRHDFLDEDNLNNCQSAPLSDLSTSLYLAKTKLDFIAAKLPLFN